MPAHHVLILYNQPILPLDHPDAQAEYDILNTTAEVAEVLHIAGFKVSQLGLGREPATLLQTLDQLKPDVVFNLFEGNPDEGDTEAYVAGLLQWLRIPFTGSPMQAMSLARDKIRTKLLLQGAGLPTAAFMVADHVPVPPCQLSWPVIVKHALQDASVGLDHGSVVTDHAQLNQRVAMLLENYGPPILIEEYIAGREINVALWESGAELRFLAGEITFQKRGAGFWPIVTYASKWHSGSADDVMTPPHYPAELPHELSNQFGNLARQAYRLVGCRDYGRVDFRLRPPDQPFILEVNPNPAINADDGFASCLKVAGLGHSQFLVQLVHRALQRR